MSKKIQFLAYYLPQYHPIPENDKWWGKGFTEWTNVTKAKPLFKGHYQPVLPADLGFYDLRVSESREEQAALAKEYGIDGFIYYQYWFGEGQLLLERPAEEMLALGKPDFPFCFCWANDTWKGIWHGLDNPEVLIEQTYDGEKGYIAYFNYLLPFFQDHRYIKVDNKPMFHIYRMHGIPDLDIFFNTFNDLAIEHGFEGVYFVATLDAQLTIDRKEIYGSVGLDVFNKMRYADGSLFTPGSILGRIEKRIKKKFGYTDHVGKRLKPLIYDYEKGVSKFNIGFPHNKYIPCVFPNWDNSPRSGNKSMIFKNATPEAWRVHLEKTVIELLKNPDNPQIIVVKSWNEWAEGNYLEPDRRYGHQWLEAVKKVKDDLNQ